MSGAVVGESIRRRLGGRDVLCDVSLEVGAGEIVAIVGPSGSGKTTLLSILGGLDPPDSGRVLLAGIDLYNLSREERARRRAAHIGFVFQSHNLLPALTAEENVALAACHLRRGDAGARRTTAPGDANVRARARDALVRLGIGSLGRQLPRQMSLGEQQRVAVARALVTGPAVLIADEPTASLDGDSGQRVLDALVVAATEGSSAVVLATHDERCMQRASRIIRIIDGRVLP